MIIEPTPPPKHIVDEYEIVLSCGLINNVVVDKERGDTIDISPDSVVIHIIPKPSDMNPDILTPPENHTFFGRHIAKISHLPREIIHQTPEQLAAYRTIFKLHPTIQ